MKNGTPLVASFRRSAYPVAWSCVLAVSVSAVGHAENPRDHYEQLSAEHAVDNSGRNKRDLNQYRKTAGDQRLGGTEIKTLAAIRRRIVEDDSLSTYAKNVKVIVDRRAVTLRGPVRDPIEAQTLVAFAYDTAPTLKVVDELEITPPQ